MHWFIDPIQNHYADFTGRATRQEFWMYILVYLGVAIAVAIGLSAVGLESLSPLFTLAILLPNWAITARRLHDVNKSGWWQLIALVPFGIIFLIIWLARERVDEGNRYGSGSVVDGSTFPPPVPVPVPSAPVAPSAPETVPEAEVVKENTQQGFGRE